MSKTNNKKDKSHLSVTRSIRDSEGGLHYEISFGEKTIWITLSELIDNEKICFAKIQQLGVPLLTTQSKNKFKQLIEDICDFEDGLVAPRPGYLRSDIYVCANGDIISPKDENNDVIIAFETDDRFDQKGGIIDWKKILICWQAKIHWRVFYCRTDFYHYY